MAILWKSFYEEGAQNTGAIAAAGSETFLATQTAQEQISKNKQVFNSLELNNDSNSVVLAVDLDGLSTRRRLIYPKSSWVINPEDGIFFNFVKATNTHGANDLNANELRINARIVKAAILGV